jgi:hypothetical protein
MSNGVSKPVVVNHPTAGPARKLEYFFPKFDQGEDHQGFINLINGDPPRVVVTRDRKTVVKEEIKK